MTTTTKPIVKPHHFLALAKAIAAADLDLAEGRSAAGWRTGPDVHGWLVADQLVEVGYFERNIHGQSHKDDLKKQRYRITSAGRSAYLPDSVEAEILTKLKAAADTGRFGGWLYWQELSSSNWQICDQLVGKGWIKPKTTPGKPQTVGIGNRAYRIETEGCRALALFNQKEAAMAAPQIPLGDGRRVDPETGEILEPDLPAAVDHYVEQLEIINQRALTDDQYRDPETGEILEVTDIQPDELTTDELTTRAATATSPVFDADPYPARMAVIDPQTMIANLQTDLQNALRDKYEAERQRDEARQALEKATKLPNPGEYRQLQQTAEERRIEINRLTQRVNEAESNGWKGKHETLLKSYQRLEEEVRALRQPDLEMGATLARLTEERDQLQQLVNYLQTQLDERSVTDDDTEPGIQHDFFVGVISHADTATRIAQKEKEGWEFVYEVIHADGRYNARIRRDTRTQDNIDAAIDEALKTPRPELAGMSVDGDDEPR